jgi:Tol biopolymer transport system component
MKRWMIGFIVLGIISGLGIWVSSEDKLASQDYNELIKQLGNEKPEIRENAQKELIKIGEGLIQEYKKRNVDERKEIKEKIAKLANALRKGSLDKDLELKMRAIQIRQHFYASLNSRIAFTVLNRIGQKAIEEIYIMDCDGKNQTRLTDNKIKNSSPVWSPDGTKIAFVSDRNIFFQIYVMDADGKNQTRLTKNTSVSPAWSPDGKRIVFMSPGDYNDKVDSNDDIYIMDADGKNQTRLTEDKESDVSPAWSPNGKKIAFQSDRDDHWQIYVMDADGKNQTRLTESEAYNQSPTWSPDSKKIAFAASNWIAQHKLIGEIYVMDSDGKNQTRLTNDKAENDSPTWSPDGKKIAFTSYRDHHWQIYVMDADGKNQTRLTENEAQNGSPAWSPILFPELCAIFAE